LAFEGERGNVTFDTPDLYGGAAVTTKNIHREVGLSTWTETAGAASHSISAGKTIEFVFAQGADDDQDEPFGCKGTYVVPCDPAPTLSAVDYCIDGGASGVVDDAVEGDLTVRIVDPEDGNTITASATVDIDNGDVMSLETVWQGAFEEDYGNRFTPCGNTLVYQVHDKAYTKMSATSLAGVPYPTASVPRIHSAAAGYTDYAYTVPVLKSNAEWKFWTVADLSGSGIEANETYGNVTFTLYDNNWYIDNDVTPSVIKCGPTDEDGTDIGSLGADTGNIYLAPD
jgi:hypothetical protein